MRVLNRIKSFIFYCWLYTLFSFRSFMGWLASLNKSTRIVFENVYDGQQILLLAIYEKGELRPDIKHMLAIAKAKGVYVCCVNTLSLDNPAEMQNLMDCYIERFNFGRDFGSYQCGFLHIYQRGWDKNCTRILMANDSVFYSKVNLDSFLEKMLMSQKEILGSTETHEVHYHLGAFCISIGAPVIRHKLFKDFWRRYSKTDIRPKVILRGEIALTNTLRSCASSADNLSILYGSSWFSEELCKKEHSTEFLNAAIRYTRSSDRIAWPRFSYPEFSKAVQQARGSNLEEQIKNNLILVFLRGSQIHQNASFLHYSGMPLIKLDLLYRGMFDETDVELLCEQLDSSQTAECKKLIYSRPFGGHVLSKMQGHAFRHGLI